MARTGSDDERAIRTLIETWMAASKHGDVATVLGLMADDVVFMVPGREPFGKREFAAMAGQMTGVRMAAESEVVEVAVRGDWAWCRTRLTVTVTPPDGETTRRSGYTLSILEKRPEGGWVMLRDANLLAPA